MRSSTSPWTIVTGGNRGIGLSVCSKLVRQGQRVVLCSRDLEQGRQAAERVCREAGSMGACEAAQLNVSDPDSINAFVSEVTGEGGKKIHALINNAGVFLSGWSSGVFDQTMATNFRGPLDLALRLAPHMPSGSKIVNVSSSLGQLRNLTQAYQDRVTSAQSLEDLRGMTTFDPSADPGAPGRGWPAYCLSKAMLNRATQILAQLPELSHISINAADPGWVRTEMGGPGASRSIDQGSSSVLAVYNLPGSTTGGFFYDGKPRDIA